MVNHVERYERWLLEQELDGSAGIGSDKKMGGKGGGKKETEKDQRFQKGLKSRVFWPALLFGHASSQICSLYPWNAGGTSREAR